MNQSAMLARFAREAEMDAFLVAGRYTLLDQEALPELLPLLRRARDRVLIGGVMNSGVLADPRPGAHFDYGPAEPGGPRACPAARRRPASATASRSGPPPIQFPLAHPRSPG